MSAIDLFDGRQVLTESQAFSELLDVHTKNYALQRIKNSKSIFFDLDIPGMLFGVKLIEILPISLDELNQMKVASSVLPVAKTVVKSSSGHFILKT